MRAARAKTAASASISPRSAAKVAAIRSGCAARLPARSAAIRVAAPAAAQSEGSANHSSPSAEPSRSSACSIACVQLPERAGIEPRQRDERLGPDRVRLVRHRRRPAARPRRHLADLALAEQDQVLADLPERPGDQRQPAAELGHPVARRVPRHLGRREAELGRQPPHHLAAPPLERRAGPRGPGERHPEQPRPQLGEPRPVPDQRHRPDRDLGAERRRRSDPEPRARRDHRSPVPLRLVAERRDQPLEAPVEDLEHPAQPQHQRGIDDVLARRAPVQPGAMLRAELAPECRDQRRHRHPCPRHAVRQRRRVDRDLARSPLDRPPADLGDHAEAPLDPRQRALDQQHRPHLGAGGEERRDLRRRRRARQSAPRRRARSCRP